MAALAKKPTLFDRTTAFVRTLNAITLAADELFVSNEPRVCAALITAAATLVVGADLGADTPGSWYTGGMVSEDDLLATADMGTD